MQSSVRAVEAYRRSRLIDGVTADEDKIAPVYRLEEICQVVRSSPLDVVREMLDYTLKRLEHKSPIVKQKTLRFIKYAAGKGGPEWKREMQRQAGIVRGLFHYRGQPDSLKGDALNKAVRDTAHEAVAAIFGTEEKTTTMEDVGKRIQGFGSSHYEKPREDEKKSVLSGLVGFGSQSLKQGIDMINNYNHYTGSGSGGSRSSFSGSYRSQGLRRSLTAERERFEKEDGEHWNLRDAEADDIRPGSSPKENSSSKSVVSNGRGSHSDGRPNTVEDRLLDSLTTPGGVRLQPTRETLQAFTTTAQKLDAANLVNSLEIKLKAHNWQIRYKALCLLEAAIKQREGKVLDSVTAMFEEDASAVVDCLQSPQASLRDKAKKVLDLLGARLKAVHIEEDTESDKSLGVSRREVANLPDLLDTSDLDFIAETGSLKSMSFSPQVEQPATATRVVAPPPVQHDLFGDWIEEPSLGMPVKDAEADPFAGMSFHSSDNTVGKNPEPDLFSGLDVDSSRRFENGAVEGSGRDDGSSLFDGLSVIQAENARVSQDNLLNLMGSLSMGTGTSTSANNVNEQLQSLLSSNRPTQQPAQSVPPSYSNSGLNLPNVFHLQAQGIGVPGGVFPGAGILPQMLMYPPGSGQYVNGLPAGMPGPFPANVILQPAFSPGSMNFMGMNAAFAQQQFPVGLARVPRFSGGLQPTHVNGGGLNQSFNDNFDFSGDPLSRYGTAESAKKEDTKAFDFISEHVSSQLGPKKSS